MNKLIAGEAEVKVGSDVVCGLETRLSLIQALIPIGLEAVSDVLQQEVGQLAGVRYARKAPTGRFVVGGARRVRCI